MDFDRFAEGSGGAPCGPHSAYARVVSTFRLSLPLAASRVLLTVYCLQFIAFAGATTLEDTT